MVGWASGWASEWASGWAGGPTLVLVELVTLLQLQLSCVSCGPGCRGVWQRLLDHHLAAQQSTPEQSKQSERQANDRRCTVQGLGILLYKCWSQPALLLTSITCFACCAVYIYILATTRQSTYYCSTCTVHVVALHQLLLQAAFTMAALQPGGRASPHAKPTLPSMTFCRQVAESP
jgi:hypothetical protein